MGKENKVDNKQAAQAQEKKKDDGSHIIKKGKNKGKVAGPKPERGWFGLPRLNLSLPIFLAGLGWLMAFSSPCQVKTRKDCGWSGVSPIQCQAGACLVKENAGDRKVITVPRKAGEKLGLKLRNHPDYRTILEINDGAVKAYSESLSADKVNETLRVGDRIVRVDGKTGDGIDKSLKSTSSKTTVFTLTRIPDGSLASKIPPFIQNQPYIDVLIRSVGFEPMAKGLGYLAGTGTVLWAVSGYGAASLPVWYWGSSALATWYTLGCCHNDKNAKPGEPHCFRTRYGNITEAVQHAWQNTDVKTVKKMFDIK